MATTKAPALHFTGDPESDRFLAEDPLALLVGFALDQQVTVQKAFSGPLEIKRRLGTFDAGKIAATDPAKLEEVFREKPGDPPLPRRDGQAGAGSLRGDRGDYDGHAERVWTEAADGTDLKKRLLALPSIGEMKAKTLIAVIGKRLDAAPPGWEKVAPEHMTLGDVDSAEALADYQAKKRAHKAAMRAAKQ